MDEIDSDLDFDEEFFTSSSSNVVSTSKMNPSSVGSPVLDNRSPNLPSFLKCPDSSSKKDEKNVSERDKLHKFNLLTRQVESPKEVPRRKFPGPAGILPERPSNGSFIGAYEQSSKEPESKKSEAKVMEEIMSEVYNSMFTGGAWVAMLQDLETHGARDIIDEINVCNIKQINRDMRCYRVPFLVVIIQSVESPPPESSLLMRDPSGEIYGLLHKDVCDNFGSAIAPDSVFILLNMGVISSGTNTRIHSVNITMNNVVALYTPTSDNEVLLHQTKDLSAINFLSIKDEWRKILSCKRRNSNIVPVRPLPKTSYSSSPNSSSSPSFNNPPLKRSRVEISPAVAHQKETSSLASVPINKENAYSRKVDESLVESLLEGLDADSFGEF